MQVNIYNDILYNTNEKISTSTIVMQDQKVVYSGDTKVFKLNDLKIEYPELIYNLKNFGIYVYSFNEQELFRYDLSSKIKIENKLDSYYKIKMEKTFEDLFLNNVNLKTVSTTA